MLLYVTPRTHESDAGHQPSVSLRLTPISRSRRKSRRCRPSRRPTLSSSLSVQPPPLLFVCTRHCHPSEATALASDASRDHSHKPALGRASRRQSRTPCVDAPVAGTEP